MADSPISDPDPHLDADHPARLVLYGAGLLGYPEAEQVEKHLASGCESCAAEVRAVQESVANLELAETPLVPPERLRDRILLAVQSAAAEPQVWKQWSSPEPSASYVIRSGDAEWETVLPGISAKRLHIDEAAGTVTMLIRMDPGTSYLPHLHAGGEQCFVIEGDLREGDLVVDAGDFQYAAAGTHHHAQHTENGCLLLIVSSLHDQIAVDE